MDQERSREFLFDTIGSTSIRLVKLYRAEPKSASISATLSTFPLSSLPATGFTTLSYVWGEKRRHYEKIRLNGRPFPVLESVYPVLEAICDHGLGGREWWWIDSICINQADDALARKERNSQIRLMRRIYKASKETIVWLGEANSDSDMALDFLNVLARSKNKVKSKKISALSGSEQLLEREKWGSVERLFLRPWWIRVWTLQEFIVPPKLIFYCGSKSVSRVVLEDALWTINECRKWKHGLIHEDAFLAAWNRRRILKWHQYSSNQMSLVALMAYAGNCQATDGRDRVYSLLGLAKDRDLAGVPNYQSSIETIYTKLVMSFVDVYKSLDIICFADLFHENDDLALTRTLPSWVPNWRTNVVPFVVPLMASQSARSHIGNFRPLVKPSILAQRLVSYSAAGSSVPDIKCSKDLRTLTCKAVLIDQIDGLGGNDAGVHDFVQSSSLANHFDPTAKRGSDHNHILMENIVRTLVLDREDRYLNLSAPTIPFRNEFQQLCTTAISNSKATDPRFRDWFDLNKDLLIRGHTLGALSKSVEASKPSNSSASKSSETRFLPRLLDTVGQHMMARRLITTNNGYIGMTTYRAQRGDFICVLLGCSIPVLLRKCPPGGLNNKDGNSFLLIGECYLHGYMNGEALDDGKFERQDIKLV